MHPFQDGAPVTGPLPSNWLVDKVRGGRPQAESNRRFDTIHGTFYYEASTITTAVDLRPTDNAVVVLVLFCSWVVQEPYPPSYLVPGTYLDKGATKQYVTWSNRTFDWRKRGADCLPGILYYTILPSKQVSTSSRAVVSLLQKH